MLTHFKVPEVCLEGYKPEVKFESLPKPIQTLSQNAANIFANDLCRKFGITNNSQAEFISRKLTYFIPRLMLQIYPEIRFRDYIPITGAPIYSKNVAVNIYNLIGKAKFKNSRANDYDFADTNAVEMMQAYLQTGTAFSMDFIENAASQAMEGSGDFFGIIPQKLAATDKMNELKLADLFYEGELTSNIYGLTNHPDIGKTTLTTGWDTASITQMMADVDSCYNTVIANSKGAFTPNTWAISLDAWTKINGRFRSDYSDLTIPMAVAQKYPSITRIIPDPYLNGKGEGGSDVMYFFKQGLDVAEMSVSANLVGQPMQQKGQVQIMPFITRSSGILMYQPTAFYANDGL